jgi:hypothetical protein
MRSSVMLHPIIISVFGHEPKMSRRRRFDAQINGTRVERIPTEKLNRERRETRERDKRKIKIQRASGKTGRLFCFDTVVNKSCK